MTNVENAMRSEVLDAQTEDVQEEQDVVRVGAPIEKAMIHTVPHVYLIIVCSHPQQKNPFGHEVTLLSSVMLNVGAMLGAGIYSVPGVVLNSVGSIGLLFVFWLLAPLFALCGPMVYSEYTSMFPKRSGAEVVYLEQAYPRPRLSVPVTFALTSVLLSCVLRCAYRMRYSLDALPCCPAWRERIALYLRNMRLRFATFKLLPQGKPLLLWRSTLLVQLVSLLPSCTQVHPGP
jgi:hypothetical protein